MGTRGCSTTQQIRKNNDFCKQHKFKPFYVRTWKKNEKWYYDVGSYTEFFVWADENDMEVKDDANH